MEAPSHRPQQGEPPAAEPKDPTQPTAPEPKAEAANPAPTPAATNGVPPQADPLVHKASSGIAVNVPGLAPQIPKAAPKKDPVDDNKALGDKRPDVFQVTRLARVRSGFDLESPRVTDLPGGTVVHVAEIRGRRARVVHPVQGWLSKETNDGEPVLKRNHRCDPRYANVGLTATIKDEESGHSFTAKISDFSERSGLYFCTIDRKEKGYATNIEKWINLFPEKSGSAGGLYGFLTTQPVAGGAVPNGSPQSLAAQEMMKGGGGGQYGGGMGGRGVPGGPAAGMPGSRRSSALREQARVHECFDMLLDHLRRQGRRGQYPDPNLKIHDPIKYYSQKRELWLRAYKMAQKLERAGHPYGGERGQSKAGPAMGERRPAGFGAPHEPAQAEMMRTKMRQKQQEHQHKNQLEAELYKEKLKRMEAEKRMKRLEEQLKNQNQAQMQPKNPHEESRGPRPMPNGQSQNQSSSQQAGGPSAFGQKGMMQNQQGSQLLHLLTIIRGMPGSGKSTLAAKLAKRHGINAIICSSQRYLWTGKEVGVGQYIENRDTVTVATKKCTEDVFNALRTRVNFVIVDRLNSKISDYEALIRVGVKFGYKVVIIEFKSSPEYIENFKKRSQRKLNDQQWNYLQQCWEYDPRAEVVFPWFTEERKEPGHGTSRAPGAVSHDTKWRGGGMRAEMGRSSFERTVMAGIGRGNPPGGY